jgi:hypothetical protein
MLSLPLPATRFVGGTRTKDYRQDEYDHNDEKRNCNRDHNAHLNADCNGDLDSAYANKIQWYMLTLSPFTTLLFSALSHANHLSTGLNYYQNLNDYNYNTDTTGLGGG